MCGIVGLVLKKKSDGDQTAFVLNRVEASQHRGYQGVGIAGFGDDGEIVFRKSMGNVDNLRGKLDGFSVRNVAMAHNRWQTHGVESEENSHPHLSNDGSVAVVHNGEIYNKDQIREFLKGEGFNFVSDTDTECIPNLIQYFYNKSGDFTSALKQAIDQLDGCNAILVMTSHLPDRIIVYNNSQTLSLVDNEDYYLIVSDSEAIPQGSHVDYDIHDEDFVFVTTEGFNFVNKETAVTREGEAITVDLTDVSKGEYRYFIEKEIFKQPETISRTLAGRLDMDAMEVVLGMEKRLKHPIAEYEKVILIGIGTSYNACLVGRYYFERFAEIPTEVIMGTEFFNNPFLDQPKKTLAVAISQSGKTIELVDAVKHLQDKGVEVASICNVVKSTIPKMTKAGIFLKAGPEKAVASTKAYTSQLSALYLMAVLFGSRRTLSKQRTAELVTGLSEVPELVRKTLEVTKEGCQNIAKELAKIRDIFYLGRGITWPLTFEAALKMQEISYLNARGYSASEMFHGPRAMLDQSVPCIAMVNAEDPMHKQMISAIEKCHSANAPVIALMSESLVETTKFDFEVTVLPVPDAPSYELVPFVNIIPLQLLAFYTVLELGHDPDFPRNLAKVITTR